MCMACACNPIDILDNDNVERYLLSRGLTGEQFQRWKRYLLTWKARVIKQALHDIDVDGSPHCDLGTGIVKELKERQYALAREL